jgi:catechol 2,3-dioxygenase-like lactoylglutathione lyase family enzyme
MSATTKTTVTKINTVCIGVTDQDAMIDFYVEKLGFTKRVDIPFGNGYRWVEVAAGDAETTIALAPPPEGKPAGGVETGICLHSDELQEYHAQLKAAGVDVDAEISDMGGPVPPMFWLRDPEQNVLIVVG